jgi:putative flippase GtrA
LGLSGLAVDIAVYAGLVLVGVIPVAATVVSSFLGILMNYVANAVLNFRVRLDRLQAAKFIAVGVAGLVVAAGVLQLAFVLGAGVWWSKVISLAVVVPAQFFANRLWTFRA